MEEETKPETYIHFKFPSQTFEDALDSETAFIPAIGKIEVVASQAFEYEDTDKAIAVQDNKLIYSSGKLLANLGLYDLTINITGPKHDIVCKVQIPGINKPLVSIAKSIPDNIEKDAFEKYLCIAEKWSAEAGEEDSFFFVPNDPAFLGSLGFRFEAQIELKPPENQENE